MQARLRSAAGPLPDDPDNGREDGKEVTRVPDVPNVSNFPLWSAGERSMMHDA